MFLTCALIVFIIKYPLFFYTVSIQALRKKGTYLLDVSPVSRKKSENMIIPVISLIPQLALAFLVFGNNSRSSLHASGFIMRTEKVYETLPTRISNKVVDSGSNELAM